jgi:hypothetical protein
MMEIEEDEDETGTLAAGEDDEAIGRPEHEPPMVMKGRERREEEERTTEDGVTLRDQGASAQWKDEEQVEERSARYPTVVWISRIHRESVNQSVSLNRSVNRSEGSTADDNEDK